MANTLSASLRTEHGKGVARKLRAAGKVPANLYGHGDETRALSVDAHDLGKLLKGISVENTILALQIDGAPATDVLIREVQMDPVRPVILHVDFLQVHAGETLRLQIPVRVVGAPVGVVDKGGVLDQVVYELDVECFPRDIPESATVDVSGLDVGEAVHVSDISLPGVKVLNDPELVVASVVAPTVSRTEEPESVDEGAPEPELIGSEPQAEEE